MGKKIARPMIASYDAFAINGSREAPDRKRGRKLLDVYHSERKFKPWLREYSDETTEIMVE